MARQQQGRRLSYCWDEDGSLVIRARLPAEAGALVLRALEQAVADIPLPDPEVVEGPRAVRVGIPTAAQGSVSACMDSSSFARV